jgi:hypothetical protein
MVSFGKYVSRAIGVIVFITALFQLYIYEHFKMKRYHVLFDFKRSLAARNEVTSSKTWTVSLSSAESPYEERPSVPFLAGMTRRFPLPPIDSLLNITNNVTGKAFRATIIGDVSDLLDFAVIGVAKCGTSTMMEYLNQPPLSFVFQGERCAVGAKTPERMIPALYRVATEYDRNRTGSSGRTGREGRHTLIGIKCPSAISESMVAFSKRFPHTKFIVGLRHPVHWFQSFYNFRVNNEGALPDPLLLSGAYIDGCKGVYANRVRYHFLLARLGKTPLQDKEELSLVFNSSDEVEQIHFFNHDLIENLGQKVFLYHVEQLSDYDDRASTSGVISNNTHTSLSESFIKDLSNFLGLDQTLHPLAKRIVPGRKHEDETLQAYRNSLKIDICDSIYKPLREILVEHGKTSAVWIRNYFLLNKDVFVPSGKAFDLLMDNWSIDPCDTIRTSPL